jgi:hypothetical protein
MWTLLIRMNASHESFEARNLVKAKRCGADLSGTSTKRTLVLFAQTLGIDECPRLARGIVPVLNTNGVSLFLRFPTGGEAAARETKAVEGA